MPGPTRSERGIPHSPEIRMANTLSLADLINLSGRLTKGIRGVAEKNSVTFAPDLFVAGFSSGVSLEFGAQGAFLKDGDGSVLADLSQSAVIITETTVTFVLPPQIAEISPLTVPVLTMAKMKPGEFSLTKQPYLGTPYQERILGRDVVGALDFMRKVAAPVQPAE